MKPYRVGEAYEFVDGIYLIVSDVPPLCGGTSYPKHAYHSGLCIVDLDGDSNGVGECFPVSEGSLARGVGKAIVD